jgi:hypothetical protein
VRHGRSTATQRRRADRQDRAPRPGRARWTSNGSRGATAATAATEQQRRMRQAVVPHRRREGRARCGQALRSKIRGGAKPIAAAYPSRAGAAFMVWSVGPRFAGPCEGPQPRRRTSSRRTGQERSSLAPQATRRRYLSVPGAAPRFKPVVSRHQAAAGETDDVVHLERVGDHRPSRVPVPCGQRPGAGTRWCSTAQHLLTGVSRPARRRPA